MADEIHLNDGTIIDIETGEVMEPAAETHDWRVCKAREHLAGTRRPDDLTVSEMHLEINELRRLLRLLIDVCDDWAASFPAEVLDRQEEPNLISSP